jgi:hypothetical protein
MPRRRRRAAVRDDDDDDDGDDRDVRVAKGNHGGGGEARIEA